MNSTLESQKTGSSRIYQAIGVIKGRIIVGESQKTTIELEGETFDLKLTKNLRRKLIPIIEEHPDMMLYLRVYPRFNPISLKPGFRAVTFHTSKPEQTQVNQFILSGIWQYIPQLSDQPVISIYRNNLRGGEKAKNIKTYHIPVRSFNEVAYRKKPSPDVPTSQERKFYKLLVLFLPQQGAFEHLVLLDSTEEIPPYIKKENNLSEPSQSELSPMVTQMNFSELQKTAIKLREAGFEIGAVSGKGITKEVLSTKVLSTLNNHPEAVKVL